ncbi:hypothetical protein Hanom_Chr15g01361811 [Helianthus anomalus]
MWIQMIVTTVIFSSNHRIPCMLPKTTIFIHKVIFSSFPEWESKPGSCVPARIEASSLSIGTISQVMVTHTQAWCKIWDHTPSIMKRTQVVVSCNQVIIISERGWREIDKKTHR